MISLEDFLDIFKGSGFEEASLRDFYVSVRKMQALLHIGKRSWPEILRLEETYQWPVMQKITDPALPIYRGANKKLLEAFLASIRKERRLRNRKGSWAALREVIEERARLFRDIFDWTSDDDQRSEALARRYMRASESRTRKTRAAVGIGIGAGAAVAAGAAAVWLVSRKKKG